MAEAKNVTAAKPASGRVSIGPLTATLPTDASSKLTGFTSLGHVSEDGVTNTNSPESEDIKAWGGDIVYSPQTDKSDEFQFTLIEGKSSNVLKAVYGDSNVTVGDDGKITVTANSGEIDERAWVIDMVLRGDTLKRIVIPDGKITEIGDITYKDDEVVGYELTVKALPDASGNTHYEYLA